MDLKTIHSKAGVVPDAQAHRDRGVVSGLGKTIPGPCPATTVGDKCFRRFSRRRAGPTSRSECRSKTPPGVRHACRVHATGRSRPNTPWNQTSTRFEGLSREAANQDTKKPFALLARV